MPERHKHLCRQGFTLIEVLVTISIIAVLVAIAVTGFRALERTASARKTKVSLANAASMLAEYDAETAFKGQPPYMWSSAATPAKVTTGFNVWRDGNPPSAPPAANGEDPLKAPRGSVDADSESVTSQRTDGQAVRNTAVVLREIMRLPAVKKMMSQSSDTMLKIPNEGDMAIMLDGWGNPIIYVPAAGIENIYLGDKDDANADKPFVITNTRSVLASTLAAPGVVLPGARPFFASAGPDGVFDYRDINGDSAFTLGTDIPAGNDNIYSFEN